VAPGAQVHCPVGVKWLVASVTYNLFEDSSSTMLSFSKPKDHGYSNSSPCAVTLRTLILATLPETLPDDQTPSLTVVPKSKHDATSGVYSLGQVGHLPSSAVWLLQTNITFAHFSSQSQVAIPNQLKPKVPFQQDSCDYK
jgi:hypothetical protein